MRHSLLAVVLFAACGTTGADGDGPQGLRKAPATFTGER